MTTTDKTVTSITELSLLAKQNIFTSDNSQLFNALALGNLNSSAAAKIDILINSKLTLLSTSVLNTSGFNFQPI